METVCVLSTNALNLVVQPIRLGLQGLRTFSSFIIGLAQQNRVFLKLKKE